MSKGSLLSLMLTHIVTTPTLVAGVKCQLIHTSPAVSRRVMCVKGLVLRGEVTWISICTSALLNTKPWRLEKLQCAQKKWDVITGGRTEGTAWACHLVGRTQIFPSVQNSSCTMAGDALLVSSILIRKKNKLHFSSFHEKTGYQEVKKEPHTLSSFRKMPIFSISLLGVCSHEDQESAWSELLEGPCCWSLPSTEASCLASEAFQRSFQIFLFPAVSGFFSYLGISVLMVMCVQLMPR